MATSKTVYTGEIVAAIVARYQASPSPETVAQIADDLGVSAPSVRSKLASLGVYQKAEPAAKRGKATKETLAENLREASGLTLPNIEAAGRVALSELMAHFTKSETN